MMVDEESDQWFGRAICRIEFTYAEQQRARGQMIAQPSAAGGKFVYCVKYVCQLVQPTCCMHIRPRNLLD